MKIKCFICPRCGAVHDVDPKSTVDWEAVRQSIASGMSLRLASESVGWLNSVGPLAVSPTVEKE